MRSFKFVLYHDATLAVAARLRPSVDTEGDNALILGVETPSKNANRVVHRESTTSVFKGDNTVRTLGIGKLGNVWVLLESQVVTDILNL
jgi:hypothetical protein